MIYHSITLYFIAGLIVLTTLAVAYKLTKTYRTAFISYYFYYLLFFNLSNFLLRPVQFLIMDLLNLQPEQMIKFRIVLLIFVSAPIFIMGLYLMLKFAVGLVEKNLSPKFNVFFFSYWGINVALKFYFSLYYLKTLNSRPLEIIAFVSDLLSIVWLFSIIAFIIFQSKHITDPVKRNAIKTFGYIYFTCLAAFNLDHLLHIHDTIHFMLSFAYVLPPLFYLAYFLKKYYREHPALPDKNTALTDLFSKYNISDREQEVIHLIGKGKTNQQIADSLFVSLQTIKQHNSNIYRKLNVKNRVQLCNYVRNATQTEKQ